MPEAPDWIIKMMTVYIIIGAAVAAIFIVVHLLIPDHDEDLPANKPIRVLILALLVPFIWPWAVRAVIKDGRNQ